MLDFALGSLNTVHVLLICIFVLAFYKWWSSPCKNYPPGVKGFPVVGTIPYFSKYPEKDIAKWSKEKYGPVMYVRFGLSDVVVINTYDLVNKAFMQNGSKYMDRPYVPVFQQITKNLGFGFRAGDATWKTQRNFVKGKLNSLQIQDEGNEIRINKNIQKLVRSLKQMDEVPFDITNLLACTVCNNIFHFAFGRSFDYKDKRFKDLVDTIYNLYTDPKTSVHLRLVMLFPSLQYVPPFKHAADVFQSGYYKILDFIDEEISMHHESYGEGIRDYVGAFRKEQHSSRDAGDGFDNEQLRFSILDILVAGTEILSNTMLWGFLCLLHYPSVQESLYNEIDSVFGKEYDISLKDCNSLPYTMSFIQELFRFRTPAPLGLQRLTTGQTELSGYTLPKGVRVVANLWAIHNDSNLWKDPHVFQPERHMDEDGKFVFSNKIIPFSIGGRSCPGEKFARVQAFLLITNLVRNFKFLPDPESNDLPIISDGTGGLMCGPYHFKLLAKLR